MGNVRNFGVHSTNYFITDEWLAPFKELKTLTPCSCIGIFTRENALWAGKYKGQAVAEPIKSHNHGPQ